MKTILTVPLDQIQIKDDFHRTKLDILALSESIREIGQINPIVVKKVGTKYEVVAGRRRYSALRLLQATSRGKIKAKVIVSDLTSLHEELVKIDENIQRQQLSEVEFDESIYRRKQIYETLHPSTRQHVAGAAARTGKKKTTFSEDAALKLQVNRKTIERSVRRAEKATDRVKEARESGRLSRSKVDLLVTLDQKDQNDLLDLIIRSDVATARKLVEKARKVGGRGVVLDELDDKDEPARNKYLLREIKNFDRLMDELMKKEIHFTSKDKIEYIRRLEELFKNMEKFIKFQKASIGYTLAIRKRGSDRQVIRVKN